MFTFIDWHAHFTGLKHPEEYTTTDIREFEFYIRHDYNDGEDFNYSPRLPFFFTSRNGAIQKVLKIPIARSPERKTLSDSQ